MTSGFLHFGIVHIGFNMFLLFQLGQLLEPRLGRIRFGLLYFAALLAGSLGELVIQPSSGIAGGASGAVFGLMAAAAIGLYHQGINIFRTGIGSLLILNLVLTFAIPGIAIGGHLGGAIGGAICGFAMLAPRWKGYPNWLTYVVPSMVDRRQRGRQRHRRRHLARAARSTWASAGAPLCWRSGGLWRTAGARSLLHGA